MTPTRPTSIAAMRAASANFATTKGTARGLAYTPDPTDIFISPFGKCGTTWLQQIVHGLRTGGDMDFDEITEVVPWIELAHDMGADPDAPQKAAPRAFKSHLDWHQIPKGGRYIVSFRDPVDAMVSLYHFLEGWHFEAGSISLDDFSDYYLDDREGADYWTHAMSWWGQRLNPDVLLLTFEDMKADLPGTVAQIADFMGIPADSTARDVATRQASFAFMKAHPTKFDDHLLRQARDVACGLPPGGAATKVDKGVTGRGATEVSADIRARFDERWAETMDDAFEVEDYVDLLRALETG